MAHNEIKYEYKIKLSEIWVKDIMVSIKNQSIQKNVNTFIHVEKYTENLKKLNVPNKHSKILNGKGSTQKRIHLLNLKCNCNFIMKQKRGTGNV